MEVYNFCAGPAMLPRAVMRRIHDEFLDYHGIGASIIEVSHKSPMFRDVLDNAIELFRELSGLPDDYYVLFVHGGARMQFSAVPLNIIARSATRLSCYVETGLFAQQARAEGTRYGTTTVVASSADTGFDRIPVVPPYSCPADAAYLHITSNNTVYGTRWNDFPTGFALPLVVDATSDILSRRLDHSQLGITYAGFQKNLGPSSLALVVIRDDLLGHALPETPLLLNYQVYAESQSLYNTPNMFGIYVMALILEWILEQGGLDAVEAVNNAKADLLYRELDRSGFYRPTALEDHRSITNVTFHLRDESLTAKFLEHSAAQGLLALRGHRTVGGVRASIYNGMPMEGVAALVEFMREFERTQG
ncbi:MAG TPA: 3-phosphoserine/phosphohydroxythreonine transaminase [Pseudonocardiaceae bacterium]|nr:3-phosphoserine/phosphohydroxythreonine transaminase [Pseudonocardiaceae bacterium]